MKSILDLCRELPASEPEIRERAGEFNPAVWLAIAADMYAAIQGMPDYLNSIADAKAATDTLISKWSIDVFSPRDDKWSVRAHPRERAL
jgi:hypothetical protein